MGSDSFRHAEEGEGDDEVTGPAGGGGDGVAGASRPQGVDLRVDGPRHGRHSCTAATASSEFLPFGLTEKALFWVCY